MPVTVSVAVEERLPAPVEATIYFVAAEALTNIAKHGSASQVQLSAEHAGGEVTIEVADDGVGGAVVGEGTGLQGLLDRVETLGGSFGVDSPRAPARASGRASPSEHAISAHISATASSARQPLLLRERPPRRERERMADRRAHTARARAREGRARPGGCRSIAARYPWKPWSRRCTIGTTGSSRSRLSSIALRPAVEGVELTQRGRSALAGILDRRPGAAGSGAGFAARQCDEHAAKSDSSSGK